ncbi:MAG TPA: NAD(P)-dependent oxidoreductase [Acidocella sp.]|jgi:glyoxylate reductase|nr:NAD(P)-dependent oxidoreductase [Acidocella sp.]
MPLQTLPVILLTSSFPSGLLDKIDPSVVVMGPSGQPVGANLSANEAAAVRVLVTMGAMKIDGVAMDGLPNLGLICCYGSGYEGVDLQEAVKRGIMVTYSPAANSSAVADLAMALLLAANRRIVMADKFVRDGLWHGHAAARMPVVRGLTGRRIGIFGFGAIGAKIAARAAAFETEVAYHSRSRKSGVPYAFHETLQGLADWADILMIAVRADASTRHLVNANVMKALGPEGILVNISRGSVIDEQAMIALLQFGELGSVGLDVYEHEPLVPESLKAIPRVVLAPHIGGDTFEAHEARQSLVAANIEAFLAGKPVLTPIPEMGVNTKGTRVSCAAHQ